MIDWNEQEKQIAQMVRRFVEQELKPKIEAIEHQGEAPYAIMRKMAKTFGLADMAKGRFAAQIKREKARLEAEASGTPLEEKPKREKSAGERRMQAAMQTISCIELCRYSPGLVSALGVSMGLTPNAIMAKGTVAQKERWALDLLTLDKIGAWAISEPGSGSDAFGSMKSTARRDGQGGYILNGSKTFITNGPYADTTVFICKLDEGNDPKERKVLHFVLDKGMEGFVQSKPLRKMGMHSSPTGELFLTDVKVGLDRLLGESEDSKGGRKSTKETFKAERTGVAAMALGIIQQCLDLCVDYAGTREQFGRPIGDFQLIQLKLAKMEVARVNVQNLVFRQIEMAAHDQSMTLAEASACKLYSAQAAMEVCLEAVQLFGGNGYMAEYQVEQLCRDAKVLQIYGGTDEIQVTHIARDLLKDS